MNRKLWAGLAVAGSAMFCLSWSSEVLAAEGGDVIDIDHSVSGEIEGVYVTHADGEIEARDGLPHFGDRPALDEGEQIIGLSVRPAGDGYWLFSDRGRAVPFGSADFLGDASELDLAAPMISAVATPDGAGYYLVAEDGGIFNYGTADFFGSVPEVLPGVTLDAPVVGIVPSTSGQGYLLIAADGGIFTFGDAVFLGSIPGVLPGVVLDAPIVAVVAEASGYLMVGADGGAFTFGTTTFHGSLGGRGKVGIVAIAVMPESAGYIMTDTIGTLAGFSGATELGTTVVPADVRAADVQLILDLWEGHAASWDGGATGFLDELRTNSYPDHDLAQCVATYSAEFVENYREFATIDEDSISPAPDTIPTSGDLAGLRPAGRIYTMDAVYNSGADPEFSQRADSFEVTILDGQAMYIPDCEILDVAAAFRTE